MVGVLLLLTTRFYQSDVPTMPSTPITFSCRAETLDKLMPELSKAAGVRLQAATACADDVMLIAVEGGRLDDLMRQIARVDAGEWNSDPGGGGWIFRPSPVLRREEARTETTRRARRIAASLSKQRADILKANTDASQHAQNQAGGATSTTTATVTASTGGPVTASVAASNQSLAMNDILQELDPAQLAVEPGDRIVFSTHPNSEQVNLGPNAVESIGKLMDEHNKNLPAQLAAENSSELQKLPDFVKKMMAMQNKPINGYAKADLAVSQMPYVGMLQAALTLYDAKGEVEFEQTAVLNEQEISRLVESVQSQLSGKPAPHQADSPIEWSPESLGMLEVFSKVMSGGATQLVLPPSVKPFVEDPEHHDPLSLLPTDELMAVARHRNLPIVASVPDESISMLSMFTGQRPTLKQVESDLKDETVFAQLPANGWLLVTPSMPSYARENRTSRSALGVLMRAARAKGVPSLDDVATYSLDAASPLENGLSGLYVNAFAAGALGQDLGGLASWELFRIYALMSPEMRQELSRGGRIPLSNLSPDQSDQLKHMVFGAGKHLSVDNGDGKTKDFMTQMIESATGGSSYTDEPTEVLPNGIPASGFLEVSSSKSQIVSPASNNGSGGGTGIPQVMGVDELAMLKFMSTDPGFAKATAGKMPTFTQFRLGSRDVYSFKFHLTPKIYVSGSLKDNHMPSDATIVSATDLPSDLQAAIDKKVGELKQSTLGQLSGLLGAQAPAKP